MKNNSDHHDTAATDSDQRMVEAQIGRTARAFAGVAARCVWGFPAVTLQHALTEDQQPFPTARYLTCPFLVRRIDSIEASGGVKAMEHHVAASPDLQSSLERSHQRHAALDNRGARIAASGDPTRLKCLHAHAAFELAEGGHEVGRMVLEAAAPCWCVDAECSRLEIAPPNQS